MIRLFIAIGEWLKLKMFLSVNFILLNLMFNCSYDNNSCWKKVKTSIIKYNYSSTIIEHIFFYFIRPFSCQNLSSIHAFVLHTNGLKVDADYIPELGFSSQDFGRKYHNLYSTTPSLMRPLFRTPFSGRYRQVWLYASIFCRINTILLQYHKI